MKNIEDEIDKETAERMKKYGHYELFTVDEHGRPTDAEIQDAILEAGSDEAAMEDTRERTRQRGLSEDLIEQMYGKAPSKEAK